MAREGALIQALRLLHEPSWRQTLRERPLPGDVGCLLGLLAGSPLKLGTAAVELDVKAATLLEAVRFYAQEVLLHPAADDRRVLGLGPDDGVDVAKAHYRALQAWLHPDRGQVDGGTVYAARVNAAWNHCRNAVADQSTVADGQLTGAQAPVGDTVTMRVPLWQRVEAVGVGGFAPQTLVSLAMLALCGVLLWLATRETPIPVLPSPSTVSLGHLGAPTRSAPEGERWPAPATPDTRTSSVTDVPMARLVRETGPASRSAAEAAHDRSRPPAMVAAKVEQGDVRALPAPAPRQIPETSLPPQAITGAVHSASAAEDTTATDEPPLAAHMERARSQAQVLLAFLTRKRGIAPPIWHNAAALDAAEAARVRLTQGAVFRRPQLREAGAKWTLGPDEVRLRVPVTPADHGAGEHLVDATMQWRDGQWWVSAVALEEVR